MDLLELGRGNSMKINPPAWHRSFDPSKVKELISEEHEDPAPEKIKGGEESKEDREDLETIEMDLEAEEQLPQDPKEGEGSSSQHTKTTEDVHGGTEKTGTAEDSPQRSGKPSKKQPPADPPTEPPEDSELEEEHSQDLEDVFDPTSTETELEEREQAKREISDL